MQRTARSVVAMVVLAASAVAAAEPAAAAPSCAFDATSGRMDIALPQAGDVVPVFTTRTGELSFDFAACLDGTVAATVSNVDTIAVTGGDGTQEITLFLEDGPLAPGATDEAGDSDEIEVQVDLGSGDADRVILNGSYGRNVYSVTGGGLVNLNADEAVADVDVTLAGIEYLDVFASRGDDVVDATGYTGRIYANGGDGDDVMRGAVGAEPDHSKLDGANGNDAVYGGPGIDDIGGFYGNDVLVGNGGDDVFENGANADGADVIRGGKGVDTISYLGRRNAVSVSLDDVANDGEIAAGEGDDVAADVEVLGGGKGNDVLTGNRKANTLRGRDGNDTLSGSGGADRLEGDSGDDTLTGGGGVDELYAAAGNDTLRALDGLVDLADGGAGTDTCSCDPDDIRRSLP